MKLVINEFAEGITLTFERQRQEVFEPKLAPGSVSYVQASKLRITFEDGDHKHVCEVDAQQFFAAMEILA